MFKNNLFNLCLILIEFCYFSNTIFTKTVIRNKLLGEEIEPDYLLAKIWHHIFEHSNKTLFFYYFIQDENCLSSVSHGNIEDLITNSGKGLMDLGNQEYCEDHNNKYLFLKIQIKKDILDEREGFHNLFLFTNQTTFMFGLCLWNNCTNFYRYFFDKELNSPFYEWLSKDYGILDIKFEENAGGDGNFSVVPLIIFIIVVIYIFVSAIVTLLGNFIYAKQSQLNESISERPSVSDHTDFVLIEDELEKIENNEIKIEKITNSSNIENESEDSSCSSEFLLEMWKNKEKCEKEINQCIEGMLKKECLLGFSQSNLNSDSKHNFNPQKKLLDYSHSLQKVKEKILKIHQKLSIIHSFKCLFYVKNEFYDDSNLEILSGIRAFFLFWVILDRVINYLYSLSYGFSNSSFYHSFAFIIIKYSTFAVESTIFIDGILYSFKLMSYINRQNNLNFWSFMKFFFNIVQKLFLFFLIFFILTVYIDQISRFFSKSFIFDYFYSLMNTELCIEKPYTVLIPFFIQYFYQGKCEEFDYDHCLKYVYHCLNEFYCMLLTVILFYFLYKFKNKMLDKLITLVIICITIFSYFNYQNLQKEITNGNKYNLIYILGETRLLKQPHLLFYIFFIGINCGLVYFYFIDSLQNPEKYTKEKFYYPFSYNFHIMRFLINFSKLKRYVIGFSALFFQILICAIYPILLRCNKEEGNYNLLLNFNSFLIFIFVYEKKINIILVAIITLMLLFSSEKFYLKNIFKSKVFVTISRISFPFICTDYFVYFFFAFENIQIFNWNYSNILLLTFSLYSLLAVASFILSALFELPARILYKKMMRRNELKYV